MAQISLSRSSFSFLSQGAIIQEYSVAGRNLVLSFPSPEPYLDSQYFGETIGRVANRIEKGLIQDLNGRSYQLATNLAGRDHLHGGTIGWGHRTFSDARRVIRDGRDALQFTYLSLDGEEGYPGTVEIRVWYVAYEDDKSTLLEIEYEVELVGKECEETVVNVTNHSYFNIGDGANIDGTQVNLSTNEYLIVNNDSIPTGEVSTRADVQPGSTFTLGAVEPAIDHCFVMDRDVHSIPLDTRKRELRKLVGAYHASTGDYVGVPASQHGPARQARAGFCVEPGRFINAINMPDWRRQVVLPQGQTWGSKIIYKAWKA